MSYDDKAVGSSWVIYLQWYRYVYDNGTIQMEFRFIWRRPDGSLQAARGQARIPDFEVIETLMEKARQQGWGHNSSQGEKIDNR